MKGHYVLSIFGLAFLFLSTILLIVSLATKGWMLASYSVALGDFIKALNVTGGGGGIPTFNPNAFTMPTFDPNLFTMPTLDPNLFSQPTFKPNFPNFFKDVKYTIDYKFGLKSFCMKTAMDGMKNMPRMGGNVIAMPDTDFKFCMDISLLRDKAYDLSPNKEQAQKAQKVYDDMNATFICTVIALVFSIFGIICAFVKAPCFKIPKKKLVLLATIFFCAFGVILGFAAVGIYNENVYKKHESAMAEIENVGVKDAPQMKNALKTMKFDFKRGNSFNVAAAGVCTLLFALVCNLVELMLIRKTGYDEQTAHLTSKEGYVLTA